MPNPLIILFTIVGGLAVAGIIGWVRRPRLYVVIPKLFPFSSISTNGALAEISIFNRGIKTEEAIVLGFPPRVKVELVAASIADGSLSESKLTLPRLGPGEEYTAIVLCESEDFSKSSITSCSSKETTGKVIDSLELLPTTHAQRVGNIAFLIFLPLLAVLVFHGLDFVYDRGKSDVKETVDNAVRSIKDSTQIKDWTVPSFYNTKEGSIGHLFRESLVEVSVIELRARQKGVTAEAIFVNRSPNPLIFTLHISTTDGEMRCSERRGMQKSTMVGSGVTKREFIELRQLDFDEVTEECPEAILDLFVKDLSGGTFSATKLERLKLVESPN